MTSPRVLVRTISAEHRFGRPDLQRVGAPERGRIRWAGGRLRLPAWEAVKGSREVRPRPEVGGAPPREAERGPVP